MTQQNNNVSLINNVNDDTLHLEKRKIDYLDLNLIQSTITKINASDNDITDVNFDNRLWNYINLCDNVLGMSLIKNIDVRCLDLKTAFVGVKILTFENCNIDTLYLNNNRLQDVIFINTSVRILFINENELESINSLPNNLENLTVAKNKIKNINTELNDTIVTLDLSENQIECVTFKLPKLLKNLDMSNNIIITLDGVILPEYTEIVDFSNNYINSVDSFLLNNNLKNLDLNSNHIDSYDVQMFNNLEYFSIENNPVSSCEIKSTDSSSIEMTIDTKKLLGNGDNDSDETLDEAFVNDFDNDFNNSDEKDYMSYYLQNDENDNNDNNNDNDNDKKNDDDNIIILNNNCEEEDDDNIGNYFIPDYDKHKKDLEYLFQKKNHSDNVISHRNVKTKHNEFEDDERINFHNMLSSSHDDVRINHLTNNHRISNANANPMNNRNRNILDNYYNNNKNNFYDRLHLFHGRQMQKPLNHDTTRVDLHWKDSR